MVALETPSADLGWQAPDFLLKDTNGRQVSLRDVAGENGLLVMFICNHCPYVQKQLDRMVDDAKALMEMGVGVVAIMPNDTDDYPEDGLENMAKLAQEKQFPFPYLLDETQDVARAYDAVCTPDFFGFNGKLELQYRGRLDESWTMALPNPKRELLAAMMEIAKTGICSAKQNPSIGCSIKWKENSRKAANA